MNAGMYDNILLHTLDAIVIEQLFIIIIIMCVLAKESYKVKHRVDMLHLPGSDTLE